MILKAQARQKSCFVLLVASCAIYPAAAATNAEQSPANAHDLLTKAYEQICKGSFDAAVPTLCQVVRTDRNSATARRYLAFVLLQQGQANAALGQLEALSKLQENTTFDLLLHGVAYDMTGEHDKALEFFRQTMDREPQSDYYRIKAIDQLITLQQYDEAQKLSTEGYNAAKEPKIAAVYQQRSKKIQSTLRLTGRAPNPILSSAPGSP